jgi:hypothetical protein
MRRIRIRQPAVTMVITIATRCRRGAPLGIRSSSTRPCALFSPNKGRTLNKGACMQCGVLATESLYSAPLVFEPSNEMLQ